MWFDFQNTPALFLVVGFYKTHGKYPYFGKGLGLNVYVWDMG